MQKEDFKAIGIIALFYLFIESIGITCPVKFLTGISCPGCGMSRAWMSVLRLDFNSALYYHPLFWLPLVALVVFLLRKKLSRGFLKVFFWASIAAMIIYWLIRINDPANAVVVFEPQNNIVSRIIRTMGKS